MQFSQDYYDGFFDLADVAGRFDATRQDFTANLASFLESHAVVPETAVAIARALFERMADRHLHYHTPVHVLSMFAFAEKANILLKDWEALAVWFHDAVYIPQMPGISEQLSVTFMRAMVQPAFSKSAFLKAQLAIKTTARHLDTATNPRCDRVLDLDLSHFAGSCLDACTACIRKEYPSVDDRAFSQGRKEFLTKLLGRGFIYRSNIFKERFESVAMKNVMNELESLK